MPAFAGMTQSGGQTGDWASGSELDLMNVTGRALLGLGREQGRELAVAFARGCGDRTVRGAPFLGRPALIITVIGFHVGAALPKTTRGS
jgi:hypothetical protein